MRVLFFILLLALSGVSYAEEPQADVSVDAGEQAYILAQEDSDDSDSSDEGSDDSSGDDSDSTSEDGEN